MHAPSHSQGVTSVPGAGPTSLEWIRIFPFILALCFL